MHPFSPTHQNLTYEMEEVMTIFKIFLPTSCPNHDVWEDLLKGNSMDQHHHPNPMAAAEIVGKTYCEKEVDGEGHRHQKSEEDRKCSSSATDETSTELLNVEE
jgi:hypothetical protein